jgi:hypothetical protein
VSPQTQFLLFSSLPSVSPNHSQGNGLNSALGKCSWETPDPAVSTHHGGSLQGPQVVLWGQVAHETQRCSSAQHVQPHGLGFMENTHTEVPTSHGFPPGQAAKTVMAFSPLLPASPFSLLPSPFSLLPF